MEETFLLKKFLTCKNNLNRCQPELSWGMGYLSQGCCCAWALAAVYRKSLSISPNDYLLPSDLREAVVSIIMISRALHVPGTSNPHSTSYLTCVQRMTLRLGLRAVRCRTRAHIASK